MSDRAKLYQQQITGLPVGMAVMLNGVRFDGCRTIDGVMLEAKSEGFKWAFNDGKLKYDHHDGIRDMIDQMRRQSEAAAIAKRSVEWHIAEKVLADHLAGVAATLPNGNVKVINTLPDYGTRVR